MRAPQGIVRYNVAFTLISWRFLNDRGAENYGKRSQRAPGIILKGMIWIPLGRPRPARINEIPQTMG